MRHHYVPQYLLRQWADQDQRVVAYRFDLPRLTSNKRGTVGIGFEEDLYALGAQRIGNLAKQHIETQVFRVIDQVGSDIHKRLLTGSPAHLSNEDRSRWSHVLMSFVQRHPRTLERIKRQATADLLKILAKDPHEYQAVAGPNDPATLEEWVNKMIPGLIPSFGLTILPNLIGDETIAKEFYGMKWFVRDVNSKDEILLADEPLIITEGLNSRDLILALPLSPHRVFFATRSFNVLRDIAVQDANRLCLLVNESSLNQSRTRVFARSYASQKFLESRFSKLAWARRA